MMKRIRRRRERRTVLSGWQWLMALCFAVLPAMQPISTDAQTGQPPAQGAVGGSELSPQEKKGHRTPAGRLGQGPQRHECGSGDGGRGIAPIG
jgi:hypothetical protein